MFSKGNTTVSYKEIMEQVTESQLLSYYLGVDKMPCFINSPLRRDKNPSFGLYSRDGKRIFYIDLATREGGGMYDLLSNLWHCSFEEVLLKIQKDMKKGVFNNKASLTPNIHTTLHDPHNNKNNRVLDNTLQCKVREWRDYDIEYWESYGVPLSWLKYAEVYPISHKIIIKNGQKYVFGADKLAYVFVERKEEKITLKIYQPHNKNGKKWLNKHDSSVISLWTKIPECGDKIVICSSLKDALCLWANTKIPAIALQGEGYKMSDTAISELKKRFKNIYILFDNDEAGLKDAEKLSQSTGFTNLVLPKFKEGKDISDLYKAKGKNKFVKTISKLFENNDIDPFELPFYC